MGPKKEFEIPRGPVRSGSPASQNLAHIVPDAERRERRARAEAVAKRRADRNEVIILSFGSVAFLGLVYGIFYVLGNLHLMGVI